jgi:hypothetical protein
VPSRKSQVTRPQDQATTVVPGSSERYRPANPAAGPSDYRRPGVIEPPRGASRGVVCPHPFGRGLRQAAEGYSAQTRPLGPSEFLQHGDPACAFASERVTPSPVR